MDEIPEIQKIVEDLFKHEEYIHQCIVSTIDGSPVFGKIRGKKKLDEELHIVPAAISSALSISHGFFDSTLNDEVKEYVVFQEKNIIIATRASCTVLVLTVQLPKSSFEKIPPIENLVEVTRNYAAKIDAIVKTLDIEDSLIEKLQRAIPEATAILLLSSVGIPLSDPLSSLDIDPAQLSAISSALSLPTRILGEQAQSIAVTGKDNAILLYTLDADRILMVTLKPKHTIESYLTQISRIVSPQS